MTIALTSDQVCFLRMHAQRLTPRPPGEVASVERVVKEMCGIQAQDAPAAALAVRARSAGLAAADVEQARVLERSVVRTWGPRGTLHLLASDDIGWLLPLIGPVFMAGDRRRREELGLSEDVCARAIRLIRNVLADQGPMTRAELFEQLAMHGIHLEGQARPHLLFLPALEGMICLGPDRGAEPTYVLLDDWLGRERRGHPLPEDEAYAKLTLRYLGAYGPATLEDQAAWSGLPLSKTRAAWHHIADQLMEVEVAGSPAWMLKTRAAWLDELPTHAPIVRLLPRFDIYLLGYRNRDLAVPPQYAKRINAGGGIVHPTLLADGRVLGTWKSKRLKNHLDVLVEPFDQLAPAVYAGLEAEVADLARYLGVKATLGLPNGG
ncbi:MAG TPA: winged helix DNA-binding domain-containing protein [Ktedonobacteraceae bacterium]